MFTYLTLTYVPGDKKIISPKLRGIAQKLSLRDKNARRYETLRRKANYLEWKKLFAMSEGDAAIPKSAEEKADRIEAICEVLVDFCDKGDISIDKLPFHVEQLFIALNLRMEKEPSIKKYLEDNDDLPLKMKPFISLVVGSSYSPGRSNRDTLFKTPDALAEILYNKECEVLTIGRSEVDKRKEEHFPYAIGSMDKDAQDVLLNGLNRLLDYKLKDRPEKEKKKVVVFFTLAVHDAASNLRLTDSFCDAFNASPSIKALKADRRVYVVVTGTDAILPSSSLTFYKVPGVGLNGFSPAGYSFSKLYQIIKGAMLVAEGFQMKELTGQLTKLEKIMATADSSNRFAYLSKNQFSAEDIENYDVIVVRVLSVLEGVRGFSWVKDLSVLYTSMHVDRFVAASRSPHGCNDVDLVEDRICDNVIFRSKNVLTPHKAALHHIEAALRAIKQDDDAAIADDDFEEFNCSLKCTAN